MSSVSLMRTNRPDSGMSSPPVVRRGMYLMRTIVSVCGCVCLCVCVCVCGGGGGGGEYMCGAKSNNILYVLLMIHTNN